ncbi:S-type pyocin domain-containing protein [Pseudomonas moraviensis]|uniref:Pyosin/cloacin translocation domain-containing protein n=1 Tax=Pseudomonas moraviensis TaxID=321662 RepID=A0A7Y9VTR8_9PSED|nr:S-type pyocin domain-containing protein [Pseudomonas moraviensis]NYH08008.1 hypothetical protein [Pseudomonas moraviensis]
MQRPPPFELTEPVWTTAEAPPHFNPGISTVDHNRYNGPFGTPRSPARYQQVLQNFITPLTQEYQAKAAQIPQAIEVDLAATRLEESTQPLPPAAAISRELGVRNRLIQRKNAQLQQQAQLSHGFYGSDPTDKTVYQFLSRAYAVDKVLSPNGPGMNLWKQSYRAAMEVRLLTQTLATLHQQHVNVHNWLAAVQANDAAQAQAAETARRAAELARIAAEQQRLKDSTETARRQQEQQEVQAREQARLAALAEAQRKAAEQARIAAEAAARQLAAEQAHLEALAKQQRQTEAARQARDQARADAGQRVYPASAAAASAGPVIAFASNAARLNPSTATAILTVLRSAVVGINALGASLLAPVAVGFAALLAPSRLGNGERFSVSVPLVELSSATPQALREIAQRQGTLQIPVGLGTRRMGAGAEVFVVSADDFQVRSDVPVLRATFDSLNGVYETVLPDLPNDILTWTPAISPGDSSTQLPSADTDPPTYSGAPIMPIEGRLDLHPSLEEEWERFIIVFPEDSGVAPLYVVISSPYEGGSEDGEHSGRAFNPNETGGPIQELGWATATATSEGEIIVKLHISRFSASAANKVMLERLERIVRGELEATDTDKRFYTHELREFERFRALGYGDTERPDPESPVWNNVHTATLEDFQLADDASLLYTPEALAADAEQDERDYQRLLKEMWK